MPKKPSGPNANQATQNTTTHRRRSAPAELVAPPLVLAPRVESLPLAQVCRHPDNREPTPAAILDMAAALADRGQLEPIVARLLPAGHPHRAESVTGRRIPDSGPCYQIVSGETRCLAAWHNQQPHIEARLAVDLSDAGALALLAAANATRKDLSPLERAQLLAKLCAPAAAGGGGLTREAAGKIYGLATGQAVSNVLKLLELPPAVQQLVAADKLPESFARLAGPWLVAPAALRWLLAEGKAWNADTRPSREDFLQQLEDQARRATRDMAPANRKKLNQWSIDYCGQRLFDPTPDQLLKLAVVELPPSDDGPAEARATNSVLWDTLQAAAGKQLKAKLFDKQVAAAGRQADRDDKTPTQAEAAAAARQRAQQLQARVDAWRHGWLRELIADRVDTMLGPSGWPLGKLLLWLLTAKLDFRAHNQFGLLPHVAEMTGADFSAATGSADLVAALTENQVNRSPYRKLVAHALRQDETGHYPVWPLALLEAVARDFRLDLADAWGVAQANGKLTPRLAAFFALHQSGQLDALGDELGIRLVDAPTKAAKLKLLAACPRVLKLPRAIAPLSPATSGTAGRGRRSR